MRPAGLEVVVPKGYAQQHIPALIERHRVWIERANMRVAEQRARLAMDPPKLPDEVCLLALGEIWPVEYRPSCGTATGPRVMAKVDRVVVFGDKADFDGCKRALCRWLSRRARVELPPRLDELARRHGLHYSQATVRQQRTRWGSCTRKGNISLNARLILMPPAACDYVLLHELCHTVHLDHSPRFWTLLEEHDPEYKVHKKLVRDSAKKMPAWLDHERDEEAM